MTIKQQHRLSIIKGFAIGIIVELLPFVISYLTTNQGTFELKGFYTALAAGFCTWLFSYLRTKNEIKTNMEAPVK